MSATHATPSPQFRHVEVLCIIEALFAGGVWRSLVCSVWPTSFFPPRK